MTDTNTLAPTDSEILDAAEGFRSQYMHGGTTFDEFDEIGFTRAVLAKWGTPAPASQPVAVPAAWAATSEEGNVEALGMNQSRRFDTPLYAAPQPPAQVQDALKKAGAIAVSAAKTNSRDIADWREDMDRIAAIAAQQGAKP